MQSKTYEIVNKNKFDSWERQILSTLYLPLMGQNAYSLYLTLLNDIELTKYDRDIVLNISHLEVMTAMSETQIIEARRVIEALGLLKTYNNEVDNNFIFYLYAPLEPHEFFNSPLLNNMLVGRIGSDEYEKIRFLLRDRSKNVAKYNEISASFADVFSNEVQYPKFETEISFNSKQGKNKLALSSSDITAIKAVLKKMDLVIDLASDQNSYTLAEIKNAFHLSNNNLAICIKDAFDFETGKISRKKLCAAALKLNEQPVELDMIQDNIRSQKEQAKATEFELHNSETYLKALTKVKALAPGERALIKELRNAYKLHDAVINVLFDYSYFKNDKKIVGNYILKIASSFAEKGINKTTDAMEYLKEAFKETRKPSTFRKPRQTNTVKTDYVSTTEWTDEFFKENLSSMELTEDNVDEILRKIN